MCRAELVQDQHEQQSAAEDTAYLNAAEQGHTDPAIKGRPPKVRHPSVVYHAACTVLRQPCTAEGSGFLTIPTPHNRLLQAVLVLFVVTQHKWADWCYACTQVQRSLSDNDRRNSGEKGDKALRRSSKSSDNAVGGSLLRCGPRRL